MTPLLRAIGCVRQQQRLDTSITKTVRYTWPLTCHFLLGAQAPVQYIVRWARASLAQPNSISTGASVFAGLTVVTNRQRGAVPLPRKFMNFSSQNGVIWCILGVLFLRFATAVFRSSAEAKKNKTLVKILGGSSTQDDPCRSNVGGRDPCNRCGVDACAYTAAVAAAAEAWIVSRGRITSAGKNRHRPSSIRACPSNDSRLHLLIDSSVASTAARLTAAKTPRYLNKLLQKW